MNKIILSLIMATSVTVSCSTDSGKEVDTNSFEIFCEMVANDAKPMALSLPMDSTEINQSWDTYQQIADKYHVKLYREDHFPVSMLFPAEATSNKSVVLVYKGYRLTQYEQWKADLKSSDSADNNEQKELARRFGRLLGYSAQGINELLSKNSNYRSLASFGVQQQITHLYYENINTGIDFYKNTLGFKEVDSALFKVSDDAFIKLHSLDYIHPKDQPKSTAIALLTDQLPE